ncbi:MAG: DUF1016 domain-containing protein [Bacteroidales bacterium]|nr:DUF1016 domain-containing protein [Bacteroidales bacterium]
MKLTELIEKIQQTDFNLVCQANKAVNQLLTIRNWLIGYYIVEFEQDGEERAKYGDKLIKTLAEKLKEANVKGMSFRNLNLFREFYNAFPEIVQSVSAQLKKHPVEIMQTPSAQLESTDLKHLSKENVIIASTQSEILSLKLSEKMIESLSFSHITLLIPITDHLKRSFYTIEAIKGVWSVRELKRQINSLLFERSGMSKKPELLLKKNISLPEIPSRLVKDIYTFEFLGLPTKDAVEESDLETALLDNLRDFILELGNGFCLETRQKRILIGDEYYFIDLVFYHRILKCHVLIDLKVDGFNHGHAAQLNTYLNYYKNKVKENDDNDPVGILLVTGQNKTLVEYATAGMDKNLFVSKYLLKLPSVEKLKALITQEIKNI